MLATLLFLLTLSVICNVPIYLMLADPYRRVSVLLEPIPQFVPVATPDIGGLV
jgi:hypothetical protein